MSNFEQLINDEVNRKVKEQLIKNNIQSKIDFYKYQLKFIENINFNYKVLMEEMMNKMNQMFNEAANDLRNKIEGYEKNNTDPERKNMKCNYPNCDNYNDGSIDDVCNKCANNKTKKYNEFISDNNTTKKEEYDSSEEILHNMLKRLGLE